MHNNYVLGMGEAGNVGPNYLASISAGLDHTPRFGTSGRHVYHGWCKLLPEPEFVILRGSIGEHLLLPVDESRAKPWTILVIYYML